MADIATVFHWSPDCMDAMPVHELLDWRALAVDRWNRIHGKGEGRE